MLENIMKDPMFLSAVGAAVGGFIGVVLFFIVRLCIELFRMIPKQKGTYLCAPEINQGQPDEMDGQLLHHHGKRISNKSDYEGLGVKHPLWEWTRDPVGRGAGASVIYGPYMTDPTEPGLYTATFTIKGMGFSKPEEITKDLILLKLDALVRSHAAILMV